jgi:ketosteroid isomerase-like protein
MFAAFSDGDIDAACALTTRDVKFTVIAERVTGELPNGHYGLRAWFQDNHRIWETLRLDADGIALEERGDWVLAGGVSRGTTRDIGRTLVWEWTAIVRVVDGLVNRFGVYLDREEALRQLAREQPGGWGTEPPPT